MYVPEWFRINDGRIVTRLIQENSFATIVSLVDNELFASHVPLVVSSEEPLVFVGHLAAQNSHVRSFDGNTPMLAIFHGPHAYVSPRNYATSPNVPTWNYAVVHAHGLAKAVVDENQTVEHLRMLALTFDPDLYKFHPESMDESYIRPKIKGILAFEFHVTRIEAKAKMSQNKPAQDVEGVVRALEGSDSEQVRLTGNLVRELNALDASP